MSDQSLLVTKTIKWRFDLIYLTWSGMCVLFVAIGLCRFAYTPLLPLLIQYKWLSHNAANYVGAINLAGYVFGALLAQWINRYAIANRIIKFNLLISIIALAMCAVNFGVVWLSFLRFIVGVTGAILMVLTPSTILKRIPDRLRNQASGIIFTGIGLGIVFSGTALPHFANINLSLGWLSVACFALVAMLLAWRAFPNEVNRNRLSGHNETMNYSASLPTVRLLIVAYGLFGIGLIPHTLFLVDYIHQSLSYDLLRSAMFWSLFGVGSLLGPYSASLLSDKIGKSHSLIASYFMALAAVTILLVTHSPAFYMLSAFIMGMLLPGIVSLTSARLVEVIGTEAHPYFWGIATIYYAISQAFGAYVMAYLQQTSWGYKGCLEFAMIVLLFAVICVVKSRSTQLAKESCGINYN